jgi:adenosylhomocysteinase
VFVVSGYGWCGKGLAKNAGGLGARVIVTEVDPLRALEAVMDGYEVMPIREAAAIGDIFVTVTGDINVVSGRDFRRMKDGAIVANSGHFNAELEIGALKKTSRKKRLVRDFVEEYTLKNGRRIYLLAEGRLVNLASAEGHPSQVMDMSFELENTVYGVPEDIDRRIAKLKLQALGIKVDKLTPEQKRYLESWEMGT